MGIVRESSTADAMAEAEAENVLLRKGRLFDELFDAAKRAVRVWPAQLRESSLTEAIANSERKLKQWADDHAK